MRLTLAAILLVACFESANSGGAPPPAPPTGWEGAPDWPVNEIIGVWWWLDDPSFTPGRLGELSAGAECVVGELTIQRFQEAPDALPLPTLRIYCNLAVELCWKTARARVEHCEPAFSALGNTP